MADNTYASIPQRIALIAAAPLILIEQPVNDPGVFNALLRQLIERINDAEANYRLASVLFKHRFSTRPGKTPIRPSCSGTRRTSFMLSGPVAK